MICRTIDSGVSKERLARAFGVNLGSINRRINLLEGICPDAIARLQDKQFTLDVTRMLRNMKAAQQVEAVEFIVASNTITVAHADGERRVMVLIEILSEPMAVRIAPASLRKAS